MNPASFRYSGTELDALASATNYYGWILSNFAPYLGKKIIEVGAGIGTFSDLLLGNNQACELTLIEPGENLFPLLAERFSGEKRVRLVRGYLEDLPPGLVADSIVLVNVLEHVRDAQGVLEAAHGILVAGGTLLLFLPALPSLYGALDKAFEHIRRYTKPFLAGELQKTGFRLECLRYFNFPGVFSWFLSGKVLRRNTLRPMDVGLDDRRVVPWCSKIEQRRDPPIGQNLVAVVLKQ